MYIRNLDAMGHSHRLWGSNGPPLLAACDTCSNEHPTVTHDSDCEYWLGRWRDWGECSCGAIVFKPPGYVYPWQRTDAYEGPTELVAISVPTECIDRESYLEIARGNMA